jgi:putative colanic acid biosynthesis UDP-glucose lipid carrier transferase
MGLGRSHLFTAVEAGLDPLVLVFSLWALAFYFEGSVRPAYLILSVIVFSLTFPGSSQLRLPVWKVMAKIAFHWIWIAGLLLLTGYVTEYFHKFSMTVLGHWLWVAPVAQAGAHIALRAAAPQLLKLQGPPRGAVIVGMNEQGVSLARHIAGSAYSGIELKGFFDDRGEDRRDRTG